jgi:hypothetical protein
MVRNTRVPCLTGFKTALTDSIPRHESAFKTEEANSTSGIIFAFHSALFSREWRWPLFDKREFQRMYQPVVRHARNLAGNYRHSMSV